MLGSFFRISESSVTHLRSSRFSMASAKHQFCIFHLLEWLGYLEKSFRFLHEGIPPRQFSSHLSAYRNILVILSRNLSSAARFFFFCAHFCVMNIVRQNDSTQPSLITLKRLLSLQKSCTRCTAFVWHVVCNQWAIHPLHKRAYFVLNNYLGEKKMLQLSRFGLFDEI